MPVSQYVCPSVLPHGTTRLRLDRFSWNLIYVNWKNVNKLKFRENLTRIAGTLQKKTNVYLLYYLDEFFLEWEMFQVKVVEKIETHTLCSTDFFPRKLYRLWYNVEQCVSARQATDWQYSKMLRSKMRLACRLTKARIPKHVT